MKTRIVYTKIWHDDWFSGLNRAAKLIFLYLLTNPEIGMTGFFELPDRVILFDVGINQSELDQAKKELIPKVRFFKGWVYVLNSDRYNSFRGEKNETARDKEDRGIPLEIKTALVEGKDDRVSIPNAYPIDTSIILNHNQNGINIDRIVKGRDYGRPEDITDEIINDLVKKYNVTPAFVWSKLDDIKNWSEAKGKIIHNYKATLAVWVKKDALQIKQHNDRNNASNGKPKIVFVGDTA